MLGEWKGKREEQRRKKGGEEYVTWKSIGKEGRVKKGMKREVL